MATTYNGGQEWLTDFKNDLKVKMANVLAKSYTQLKKEQRASKQAAKMVKSQMPLSRQNL